MVKKVIVIISLVLLTKISNAQINGGQYVFEIRSEIFSTYVFSSGSQFISFQSGDMGSFYGEGLYKIIDDKLILNYDSTGIAKRVNKEYYIMSSGTDTLRVQSIKRKKLELYCDYTAQIEKYKRLRYRPNKKQY